MRPKVSRVRPKVSNRTLVKGDELVGLGLESYRFRVSVRVIGSGLGFRVNSIRVRDPLNRIPTKLQDNRKRFDTFSASMHS